MPKYNVADDHWEKRKEAEREAELDRVHIDDHTVDVIFTTDPDADMGYGREKYTVRISHSDEERDPTALHAIKHRWKGNFWREHTELDWRDVPLLVRRRVASVVACDNEDALQTAERLIEEGGVPAWQRHRSDDDPAEYVRHAGRMPAEPAVHLVTYEERDYWFRERETGQIDLAEIRDADGEVIPSADETVHTLPDAVVDQVRKEGLSMVGGMEA